ncbi:hypothetical protein DYE50_06555 [Treponema ruminis]|uniref:Uncharacterized protein n=1 Tax=Treponema ruminis TaxID=744515 RepID=A0A7W8G9X0_9SPIR|nr:hypothetical protein [Treponema ruminis]MBB5226538.1 hypothetical protein [Treponema ruminis]QSI02232.1 hypothetical protein DYE50_06555 [Treponema ruminis]
MNNQSKKENQEQKALERCEALAELVLGVKDKYKNATDNQKAFIETTIGAALWYLPELENSFTGYISINCLKTFKDGKPKISEEHLFPRKISARELLKEKEINGNKVFSLYKEKFCKLCFVTSEENKQAKTHQKPENFEPHDLIKIYNMANISLIKITKEEYNQLKKKNKDILNELLNRLPIKEILL